MSWNPMAVLVNGNGFLIRIASLGSLKNSMKSGIWNLTNDAFRFDSGLGLGIALKFRFGC